MKPPKLKAFQTWLFEGERSDSTIEAYTYAVENYFNKYKTLNKVNMIDWKRRLVNDDGYSYKTANARICGMNVYCSCNNIRPLTRPPQSWCYVEEV